MSKTFCKIPFTVMATFNDDTYHHCCDAIPSDVDPANFTPFSIHDEHNQPFSIQRHSFIQVWNSEFYKKLRLDMTSGIQNPSCNHCWRQEDLGLYSHRLKENKNVVIDREIKHMNADGSMSVGPKYLEIRTGNFCNLKCIMCHPANSTEIVKEVKLWRQMLVEIPRHVDMPDETLNQLDRSFDGNRIAAGLEEVLDDVEEIQFYGGEPLATHEVVLFLDHLIMLGKAGNLKIKMISNLSISNQKIFDRLDQFKEVEIIASWDHVDPVKSHFIRYPLDHAQYLKNFERMLNHPTYHLKISPTISVFNIYDVPAIFDHFEKINNQTEKYVHITANILEIPNYFSLPYLKQDQKNIINSMLSEYINKNKSYKIFQEGNSSCYNFLSSLKNFINQQPIDYNEVVSERTRVLELYDQTRSTDSKKLFPYLYE
jgi:MoaA/NifB/PqqE/SkfB family radical SAM enzyme